MTLLPHPRPVVLRLELDRGRDGEVGRRVAGALPLLLVDEPGLASLLRRDRQIPPFLRRIWRSGGSEQWIAIPPPAHHQRLQQVLHLPAGPSGGRRFRVDSRPTCGFLHNAKNAFVWTAALALCSV